MGTISDEELLQRSCDLVDAAHELNAASVREESLAEILLCVEAVKLRLTRYQQELERLIGLCN